jgi:hypothetical protein
MDTTGRGVREGKRETGENERRREGEKERREKERRRDGEKDRRR